MIDRWLLILNVLAHSWFCWFLLTLAIAVILVADRLERR